MAFSAGTVIRTVFGNKRVAFGQATQGNGDTGGAIETGLATVESFTSSVHCTQIAISGGEVTITTADPTADQTIGWQAIGT